jgi:hypothetical protein
MPTAASRVEVQTEAKIELSFMVFPLVIELFFPNTAHEGRSTAGAKSSRYAWRTGKSTGKSIQSHTQT